MKYEQFIMHPSIKYALTVIGLAIGTEIVYKCIKYVSSYLGAKNTCGNVYNRVIFFPDEGILSIVGSGNRLQGNKQENELLCDNQKQNDSEPKQLSLDPAIAFQHQPNLSSLTHSSPHCESNSELSNILRRSTSLIHMIKVLDSAKKSLSICVFLLSSSDLLKSIVHAKERGVRVRVILSTDMSSASNVTSLLQNDVPVRYSKPSKLMHHKFAIIDAPEFCSIATSVEKNKKRGKINVSHGRENLVPLTRSTIGNGLIMTGSFNWTWSGVVSNHENVIITNDPSLIIDYAEEFEKLWTLFGGNDTKILSNDSKTEPVT